MYTFSSRVINQKLEGAGHPQIFLGLRKVYYSLKSKDSISLKVAEETKLFPDSAFGNSLCTRAYKPKSEKPFFFFLASHTPRN